MWPGQATNESESIAASVLAIRGHHHGDQEERSEEAEQIEAVYAGRGSEDPGKTWDTHGLAGRPDLQTSAVDNLCEPAWAVYQETRTRLGIEADQRPVSPLERTEALGIKPGLANRIANAKNPQRIFGQVPSAVRGKARTISKRLRKRRDDLTSATKRFETLSGELNEEMLHAEAEGMLPHALQLDPGTIVDD